MAATKRLDIEQEGLVPREGVIIECPPNGHFHDLVNVILMSRTAISEMVLNVNANEGPLGKIFFNVTTVFQHFYQSIEI